MTDPPPGLQVAEVSRATGGWLAPVLFGSASAAAGAPGRRLQVSAAGPCCPAVSLAACGVPATRAQPLAAALVDQSTVMNSHLVTDHLGG